MIVPKMRTIDINDIDFEEAIKGTYSGSGIASER
jgi:hypothetical protein